MSKQEVLIAIAGNPNSGKTTVFNKYTGSRQHVGNYPGITVEQKKGNAEIDGETIQLIDLPGTYSLTAYSLEEVVARRALSDEQPGAVLNVVNAGVLERNLYLTVQLLEMGIPVALALNMMDEIRSQGFSINIEKLSELMNVPAVGTVGRTGENLDEALRATVKLAKATEGQAWKPLEISYGPDVDKALQEIIPIIEEKKFLTARYPARWIAIKYLELDEDILEHGDKESASTSEQIKAIVASYTEHMKLTLNTYPEAIIADYRYGYISSILRQGVLVVEEDQLTRLAYSDKVDSILTHRVFGPIIMLAVLYLMYFITFTLGNNPKEWVEEGFALLGDMASTGLPDGPLKSLIISGVINGVGGVFSFAPLILIMFMLISVLEDSGYMARVAYMVDRIFRMFGLHGASVMPFIVSGGIAGGCAVPGIMSARTLRSPKERLATILTAPFMVCGAKLPVFILFVGVFFSEHQTLVMFALTLAGWLVALIFARILRSTIIRGASTPFVMELPPYRFPTFTGVLLHSWERIWQYLKKAGTVILAISILLWVAMTYPQMGEQEAASFDAKKQQIEAQMTEQNKEEKTEELTALENEESALALRSSIAGRVGTFLEPVTAAAGFDWKTNIALIGGIAAKEVVISTLGTAYSLGSVDPEEDTSLAERIKNDPNWTRANAVALLLFTLLYSPCFVTLIMVKHETGLWRWSIFSLVFNLLVAYAVAVAANHLILLFS